MWDFLALFSKFFDLCHGVVKIYLQEPGGKKEVSSWKVIDMGCRGSIGYARSISILCICARILVHFCRVRVEPHIFVVHFICFAFKFGKQANKKVVQTRRYIHTHM